MKDFTVNQRMSIEEIAQFDFENELQKNIRIAEKCSLKLKRTKSGKWKIMGKRFNKRHLAVKYFFKINY